MVGEAPGASENKEGIQFVGKAGQHLWDTLEKLGYDRKDCWTDNAIRCWPSLNGKNRTPTPQEISYCRPNLERTIREKDPDVILLLGAVPISSFLAPRFPSPMSSGGMGRWTGWKIPCRSPNAWVIPTWHPSYIIREKDKPNGGVLQREWERHLEQAFETEGKPWREIPNEQRHITSILDPEEAAKNIRVMMRNYDAFQKPIALDYETNMLKPDSKEARIVCCSVSQGGDHNTFAFPWTKATKEAMEEFLRSNIPKIGFNTKFEDRWTMKEFGYPVRNWIWDGMNNAHIIDNRPGVTGADFQMFVLMGMPDYWSRVHQFFKGKKRGGNVPNRIGEVDLKDLLVYCGMDSLGEYKVAEKQAEEMGVKLW